MRAVLASVGCGMLGLSLVLGKVAAAELVVGQVAPLSGVLGSTGRQMVAGARLYFDSVNAAGGVHGAKIRHVVLDDGYLPEQTVAQTERLLQRDKPVALIGFTGGANIGELFKRRTLESAGIALVAPYTGSENLRGAEVRHIFHIRAGYADEARYIVEMLMTLGMDKIAVFYQNDRFGESGLAGVEKALATRQRKPWVVASYERNTAEVEPAVSKLLQAEPSAIVMISLNKSTAAFARQYRQAGGTAQLFNLSPVDAQELVALGGIDSLHGLGIAQVVPYPFSATLPVIREYQRALKQFGGKDDVPSYAGFEEFIGAKVLVEALRRAGPTPSREQVLAALQAMAHYDMGGFSVGFSPSRRIGSRYVDLSVIGTNGRLMR